MAPHSSTFAWKIPWTEKTGRLQSMGSLESDTTERLHFDFSLSCIGEGNGNPLQCSCLENPRHRGAWWAVVYGVTQSRTRLKRLSSSSTFSMDILPYGFDKWTRFLNMHVCFIKQFYRICYCYWENEKQILRLENFSYLILLSLCSVY